MGISKLNYILYMKLFTGFIWGPVFEKHNEILKSIDNLLEIRIYDFDKNQKFFKKSLIDIYKTDDVCIEKVKNIKLKNLSLYPYKYVYFTLTIPKPLYRKKTSGTYISTIVEIIKKDIRDKWKSEVDNYVHDIIIHISDNTKQSTDIRKIMEKYTKYITP